MRKVARISILNGIILMALFFQACEYRTQIPLDELPEFRDQIVINSSLDNRNRISVEITNTAWAYGSGSPSLLEDVNVEMRREGDQIPLVFNASSGKFESNIIPGSGEHFSITAFLDGYLTVASAQVIPEPIPNKQSGYIEGGGIDLSGRTGDVLYIDFDDPGGEDFYELHFLYYSELAQVFIPFDFELTDPTLLSPNTLKLNSGGYLFSDEKFNGKRKSFKAVATSSLVAGNSDIKYLIQLRRVSKDYWKYWRTLQQFRDEQDQLASGPFGSAVIIHSNITGGTGIFMSSYLESDTLR
ncbi:MAG: DUF4249 domain-containing protein [Flavobacteriales bacterium]|nr:DUF4249 domain-containing protein [Flavobacteriales bacterium]